MAEIKQEAKSLWERELGKERTERLIGALENTQPPVSVRLNPLKPLSGLSFPDTRPMAWCQQGRYLSERPEFIFDPCLHQGCYYVQEASSMAHGAAIERCVEQLTASLSKGEETPVLRYLDACAAPGGKTIGALAALPEGSLVMANEYDFRRAEILRENLVKWGSPNVVVSRGDTARFARLPEFFDIVAVDAPCSGEGMMRKDHTAREQWTADLVKDCAARQRQILMNVWKTLKPGGFLVYSTCTFNRSENEENLRFLVEELGAEPIDLSFPEAWGVSKGLDRQLPALRFLPSEIEGEGLFLAAVRKPGIWVKTQVEGGQKTRKKKLNVKKSTTAGGAEKVVWWLNEGDDFVFSTIGDKIIAMPKSQTRDVEVLSRELDLLMCGVEMATVKGRDIIPAHPLAMSTVFNCEAFPKAELSRGEAIAYLRRDNVTLPAGTPKGFVAVTYESRPLGFVKNLGTRANNLYPANYRILRQPS